MSIPNFVNKIKGVRSIDTTAFLYVLIIIGVGVSAFGLGRLSARDKGLSSISTVSVISLAQQSSPVSLVPPNASLMPYVASKNGKLYYTTSCSGAKRIATKNEVRFMTAYEAEQAGYTASPSCAH